MAQAAIQASQAQESGGLDEDEEEAPLPAEVSFNEADASALDEHDADVTQDGTEEVDDDVDDSGDGVHDDGEDDLSYEPEQDRAEE